MMCIVLSPSGNHTPLGCYQMAHLTAIAREKPRGGRTRARRQGSGWLARRYGGWRGTGTGFRAMFVLSSKSYGVRMTKSDIKALGVQERVLLFCLGSGTDWKRAGVTLQTVAGLVGKLPFTLNRLVTPLPTGRLALTNAGRAALRELLRDL